MFRDSKFRKLALIQLLIWVGVSLTPALISFTLSGDVTGATFTLKGTLRSVLPLAVLYFSNYLILAPLFWFSEKKYMKVLFLLINAAMILIWDSFHLFKMGVIPPEVYQQNPHMPRDFIRTMSWISKFTCLVVQCILVLIATTEYNSVRTARRLLESEQEKRNAAEAELSWLKNQLNPHFLFNSLNNISSLTQIDANRAQESIWQLSDLLRYALYETKDDFVPVAGEIEFMENYIALMELRCSEMTKVKKHFGQFPQGTVVAPLLFISLIENAFKHGVNTRVESLINVDMTAQGHDLVFLCENSVCSNADTTGHAGSGIGLENLSRRLDLIYKGKYSYEHIENDGVYRAMVVLKDVVA